MDASQLGRLFSRDELLHGDTTDPPPSHVLGRLGGYDLLEEIGRGGMGVVYRARQTTLDRVVALKVILGGASIPEESIERFLREAQAAGRVEHPHIVPVYEVGEADGRHFFSMQLVEGPSLETVLQHGLLTVPRVLDLVRKVALALHAVHERGIIHRDVKPSNILLDRDGEPKLADFGISRFETAPGGSTTGTCIGSPSYASPEQLEGRGARVDRRTDVFSLGATLFQALTGRTPFARDNVFLTMQAIMDPEAPPHPIVRSDAGPEGKAICLKALSKLQADRYATALDMANDLDRAERGEPVTAAPTPLPVRWRRWAGRRRLALLVSLALVVTIGVVLLAPIFRRGTAIREAHSLIEQAALTSDATARRKTLCEARDLLLPFRESDWASPDMERVEREIAALDRDAEGARLAALTRERDAERVLEKSAAVGRVLGRWARLGGPIRELERLREETGLEAEARSGRAGGPVAIVQAFLEETPRDSASQATARALAAWATLLAGNRDGALSEMRTASSLDPEVPYGAVMEALVLVGDWARVQKLPHLVLSSTGSSLYELDDAGAGGIEGHERLSELLSTIDRAPVWGPDEAVDLRRAVEGVRAIDARDLKAAEAELGAAIVAPGLAPFRIGLCVLRAKVRFLLGRYQAGLEDVEVVLAEVPGHAEAAFYGAELSYGMGMEAFARGQDPMLHWNRSLATYDGLLARGIEPRVMHTNRGRVWFWVGEALGRLGGDRIPAYDRAIEDQGAAMDPAAPDPVGLFNLGVSWTRKAEATVAMGEDASRAFERAKASLGAALDLRPAFALAWSARAALLVQMAAQSRGRPDQAEALCRRAIEDCDQAIAQDPGQTRTLLHRAQARLELANVIATGRTEVETAIRDLDALLVELPSNALALQTRGGAWGRIARALPAGGKEAEEAWERSLSDYGRAVEEQPGDPNGWYNRGLARQRRAEDLARRGMDASTAVEEAIADLGEATQLNPRMGLAWYQRANTRLLQAELQSRRGEDPVQTLEAGLADAERAVGLGAERSDRLLLRANVRMELADLATRNGKEDGEAWDQALADCRRARELAPRLWQAWWGEGRAWLRKGEARKAVEALERATSLSDRPIAGLVADLEAARKAAAAGGR